jgi:hypothetical protein
MFSEEFRQRLKLGKYTRWAVDLTEQQLEPVLWMVGEYGYRSQPVLNFLKHHRDESAWNQEGFSRALLALETLLRIVGGDRPDLDEVTHRVRLLLAEVRAAAEAGIKPPPSESLAERWPVSWQRKLVGWVVAPILDEYGGCAGRWVAADTPAAAEFLASLSGTPLGEIRVLVGGIPSWIKSPPDESGQMSVWWWVSPHNAEPGAPPDRGGS